MRSYDEKIGKIRQLRMELAEEEKKAAHFERIEKAMKGESKVEMEQEFYAVEAAKLKGKIQEYKSIMQLEKKVSALIEKFISQENQMNSKDFSKVKKDIGTKGNKQIHWEFGPENAFIGSQIVTCHCCFCIFTVICSFRLPVLLIQSLWQCCSSIVTLVSPFLLLLLDSIGTVVSPLALMLESFELEFTCLSLFFGLPLL